eukprot:TRINITY_DN1741_c0_g1_i6.p1 TRINITY_DN1741_c0_g1~~TRINITY_DN1741_c0_g1_i6.p1  ORF type:complete len:653 (+),score=121.61 TRINITY_DN1741_c0_g1_i6:153-2111(+)
MCIRDRYQRRVRGPTHATMSCTTRLSRDFHRLQLQAGSAGVDACVVGGDLMLWHGNIRWRHNKVLHIELKFPELYPAAPPTVRLITPTIRHFCVDAAGLVSASFLLDEWTSAMDVSTLLLTLQSFLADEALLRDPSTLHLELPETALAAHSLCPLEGCQASNLPEPEPVPEFDWHVVLDDYGDAAVEYCCAGFKWLPFDIGLRCCASLSVHHLKLFTSAFKAASVLSSAVQHMREHRRVQESLLCFHTKATFIEESLGVGVRVGGSSKYLRARKVDMLASSMDLVSFSAVEYMGVRQDSQGHGFDHWLPLHLSPASFQPAALEQACARILEVRSVLPKDVLKVLTTAMSTAVLDMATHPDTASLKAVSGLFAFRRVLLAYVRCKPELSGEIDKIIRNFLTKADSRLKSAAPNLSTFLAVASASPRFGWADLKLAVVAESFERSAMWFLRTFPQWDGLDPQLPHPYPAATLKQFLDDRLHSARVGLCVLGVWSSILNQEQALGRPAPGAVPEGFESLADRYFGFGPERAHIPVQRRLRQMHAADSWEGVFKLLQLDWMGSQQLTRWLAHAAERSLEKGYHSQEMIQAVLTQGDVFAFKPHMEQLQLSLGWVFSGQATQYLDASVVVVSKTNAVQGVVDYKLSLIHISEPTRPY